MHILHKWVPRPIKTKWDTIVYCAHKMLCRKQLSTTGLIELEVEGAVHNSHSNEHGLFHLRKYFVSNFLNYDTSDRWVDELGGWVCDALVNHPSTTSRLILRFGSALTSNVMPMVSPSSILRIFLVFCGLSYLWFGVPDFFREGSLTSAHLKTIVSSDYERKHYPSYGSVVHDAWIRIQ